MRYFKKGMSWMELEDILSKQDEFRNSSKSFRGETWSHGAFNNSVVPHPGRMDEAERLLLVSDSERHGLTYVVWSYATPIAWRRSDGFWRVTDRNYSRTTACHLSPLRTAIDTINTMRLAA